MYKGSSWNKWDLHFHTPSSYDYQNKAITNQDIIDTLILNNVKGVAITDHHVIDVSRIRELQNLSKDKIAIFPGIEFRAELGGSESIHFIGIFSPESNLENLWTKISGKLNLTQEDIQKKGGNELIYCNFIETCKIVQECGGIVSVHAGSKSNTIENITNSLSYKMAIKKDLVEHIHIFELGKTDDINGYNNMVFPNIEKIIPLVICSDNHNIFNYSTKENLWIKADLTFEGLKQIIFEPEYRTRLSKHVPNEPANRVNKVSFDIPQYIKIKADGKTEYDFCIEKLDLPFSPGFTCLIGGRGSGKSTILNLIAAKLGNFADFEKINFVFEGRSYSRGELLKNIQIDSSTSSGIEFVSQNQIEQYAGENNGNSLLTNAIYKRILQSQNEFEVFEVNSNEDIITVENQINLLEKKRQIELQLFSKKQQLDDFQRLISLLDSDDYRQITNSISLLKGSEQIIQNSKIKYFQYVKNLNNLLSSEVTHDFGSNNYDSALQKLNNSIKNLLTEEVDFTDSEKKLVDIKSEINRQSELLNSKFKDKHINEDDIKDYEKALRTIPLISKELESLFVDKMSVINEIGQYNLNESEIIKRKELFQDAMNNALTRFNDTLKKVNSSIVKEIKFEYEFDLESAKNDLYDDFEKYFKEISPSEHRTRRDALGVYLFCIEIQDLPSCSQKEYLDKLQQYPNSNAKEKLKSIFSDSINFDKFKLLAFKQLINVVKHKLILGYYDDRELKNCSFGQRCTAVIVCLLMFGNKPIIIDEPEAHLDSKLIADYLVGLIKSQKLKRQIIFATHNANFVINGDADLIHILDMDSNNKTFSIPTSIENLINRDKLFMLEGGKVAFSKRDKRMFN